MAVKNDCNEISKSSFMFYYLERKQSPSCGFEAKHSQLKHQYQNTELAENAVS